MTGAEQSVVQGYALDVREYEEHKKRADHAQTNLAKNSNKVKSYIRIHGPVICNFNNCDDKMIVYLDADGRLCHINAKSLFNH